MVPLIDSYRFGRIVVDGVEYTKDLIIFPDRVKSDWWRRRGHELAVEDLEEVLEEKPEVLVVGTGAYGLMRVLEETRRRLKEEGIELIAQRTGKAYKTYNELLKSGRRVAAALHLTC
ncbi:Mth938-like domain-containing protein [Candidatus Bathyarchaeota archaeon]|nr:Mth938-like domain-containing protein [Candidatus Bathyarchaeota archaeon]